MENFYNVSVAMNPSGWADDENNDLGESYTAEFILDEIMNLGFSAIEMCHKFPNNSKELTPLLAERGLVLASGWADVLFIDAEYETEYMESLIEQAKFLKTMGCRYVICCEVGNSSNMDPRNNRTEKDVVKLNDEQYKRLAQNLSVAGRRIKEMGMELVYHVHAGTVIETFEETKKLLSLCEDGTLYILADTGHQLYCNEDPLEYIKSLLPYIKYIHLKDVRADILSICREYKMSFKNAARNNVFTVPGDGDIDFISIINYLKEVKYQGWIVVEAEQNPKYANPHEYGQKAVNYMEDVLKLPVVNPLLSFKKNIQKAC